MRLCEKSQPLSEPISALTQIIQRLAPEKPKRSRFFTFLDSGMLRLLTLTVHLAGSVVFARSMKHFFETRPIFHWNSERISGHIMLNLLCLVSARFILEAASIVGVRNVSEQEIRLALRSMQRSIVEIQGKQSSIYASIQENQEILLKAMNIKRMQKTIL